MTEGNHEKNPNQFGQKRDLNSELSKYEFSVFYFDRRCSLFIQELYHRCTSQSAGAGINLHLQPLQRCYFENSESSASACVMRRHYSIMYTEKLHAINGLLAVGREGMGGSPGDVSENPVT